MHCVTNLIFRLTACVDASKPRIEQSGQAADRCGKAATRHFVPNIVGDVCRGGLIAALCYFLLFDAKRERGLMNIEVAYYCPMLEEKSVRVVHVLSPTCHSTESRDTLCSKVNSSTCELLFCRGPRYLG